MKVSELIEMLRQYPQDMEAMVSDRGDDGQVWWYDITCVRPLHVDQGTEYDQYDPDTVKVIGIGAHSVEEEETYNPNVSGYREEDLLCNTEIMSPQEDGNIPVGHEDDWRDY